MPKAYLTAKQSLHEWSSNHGIAEINVRNTVGDCPVCGWGLFIHQDLRVVSSDLGPGSRDHRETRILYTLVCKGEDGMAWEEFDGIHFSFQCKELSRKNSSHSKIKADALWYEQDRLIYGAWNWKCGLRMTMRTKITWLTDWSSVPVCVSLGREALGECSCHPGRLRLSFPRGIETFKARWKKVRNTLVIIKPRTPLNLFIQSTDISEHCYLPGAVLDTEVPQGLWHMHSWVCMGLTACELQISYVIMI